MKTQMKFQRWLCLGLVILGAVMVVYACVYKTGMLAALGTLCDKVKGEPYSGYEQAQLFFDTESFNTALLWLGIVSLLSACLLYVFANHKRRNYYAGNYVVSIFTAVVNFGVAVVTVIFNSIYLGQCADIKADVTFIEKWSSASATGRYADIFTFSTNIGMFVFGYILCVLLIASAVFLILNMLWKRNLMQGEKKLLETSFAEEVA